MDKQLAGLHPKTQEAYHRVMSTPVQPVQPTQPVQVVPQQPTPPPTPQPAVSSQPINPPPPNHPAPQGMVTPQVVNIPTPPPAINESNSQVFSSKKKAGHISPVVMIAGIVVFFAVYTLIWARIFNAPIPFLP